MRIRSFLTLSTAIGMLLALLIAGCGSASPTPGANVSPTDTVPAGPSATVPPANLLPIKTNQITINGKSQTVLTAVNGRTLYYRTTDSASGVCSGACAGDWPPIIAVAAPTSSVTLPGKLATLQDDNGAQVTYNGHPLYMFSGDNVPGDANGEGVGNIWFAVTTNVAVVSLSSSTGPTPTPNSYYGH